MEKLPADVLEDLSVEIDKIVSVHKDGCSGYYTTNNIISLDPKLLYRLPLFKMYENSLLIVLAHEIGHSLDSNGYIDNTEYSSDYGYFRQCFETEMIKYKKSGKKQLQNENQLQQAKNLKDDNGNELSELETSYATLSPQEMFAEMYAYITTSKCQRDSKCDITIYFSETLRAARILIEKIRNMNTLKRANPLQYGNFCYYD